MDNMGDLPMRHCATVQDIQDAARRILVNRIVFLQPQFQRIMRLAKFVARRSLATSGALAARRAIAPAASGPGSFTVSVRPRSLSSAIQRFETSDPRMSQMVIHNGTVYLSGQVPEDFGAPLEEQVHSTLRKVDALLAQAGTSKSKLISAMIWLKSMDDFAAMNAIWSEYLDAENKPVRACVEAPMAHKDIRFEVMVIASQ